MTTLSLLPGCSSHPHKNWIIGPVGHSRDSTLLEESNWDFMIASYAAADPDENDHEIHRFGHFAVGWVEEVAYRPGSKVAGVAETIRKQLDSYPILDEDTLSEKENEAVNENWPYIAKDLKRSLLTVCQAWEGWGDDSADALEVLDDENLFDAAHGFGEESEGWLNFSPWDIEKIATKLMPLLGFEAV